MKVFITQEFKKWLLLPAFADGLQDQVLLTFDARRGLPHNILDAKLPEASKIGKAKMEDWLIEGHISSEHPTQELHNRNFPAVLTVFSPEVQPPFFGALKYPTILA